MRPSGVRRASTVTVVPSGENLTELVTRLAHSSQKLLAQLVDHSKLFSLRGHVGAGSKGSHLGGAVALSLKEPRPEPRSHQLNRHTLDKLYIRLLTEV